MTETEDKLLEYRKKRDFSRTAEPAGEKTVADTAQRPIFVIQKHDASTLHYDFRLEIDGVLVSWAVPKGPSLDPSDKRLAVPTEDHPLTYADFEGVIAEGEYGAGPVIVWDRGSYRNLQSDKEEPLTMVESLKAGHVEVWLEGEKLQGGYALIRTRMGGEPKWLLVKMKDEHADPGRKIVEDAPASVLSERTLAEVEAEET